MAARGVTATDVWDAVNVVDGKIPRDRYGRPMVPPVKGGKPRPLTRVTTLAETLDDRYALEKWKVRQAAIGLMLRPDLLALVAAQQNDKQLLDRTCDDAIDAAKGGAAGNTGTALHGLLQRHLNQEPLDHIPAELRADIDAAMDCLTRHGFKVLHVEQFVVCEQLEAAGTPDLILTQGDRVVIGDWKTGAGAVEWGSPPSQYSSPATPPRRRRGRRKAGMCPVPRSTAPARTSSIYRRTAGGASSSK